MLRLAPHVITVLVAGPIAVGLAGVVLPAFGVMPALGGHAPSLEPWLRLLAQPALGRSMLVALVCGLVTTAVSLGVVFLFLASTAESRLLAWMRRLVAPLLAIPHAAAAVGIAYLIAPSGLLSRALSPWATGWDRPPDALIVHDPWGLAMMAGLIAKEIPFLLLMSLTVLQALDPARRLAMARSLGYRPVTAWLKAVAPGLYPLVRLPAYAVVAYASSTVDVAIILGPTNPPTLAVAVVRWFNDPDLSMRYMASAGAVTQLAVTASALLLWRAGEIVVAAAARRWIESADRGIADRPLAAVGIAGVVLASLALAVAIAGLAVASLAWTWRFPGLLPDAFTLAVWERVAPSLTASLITTAQIAAPATLMALAVALAVLEDAARRPAAGRRRLTWLLYLPLVVPQVPFLFGLVVGAETARFVPGFWLVLLGHVVFVLPYVLLSLSEAYRRFDDRWIMLGRTLGASATRSFWAIRLPMLLGPCLAAAAVGLAVSVGQYLPTLLLGAGRLETVTTTAVSLASGGDRRIVGAWVLAQAALPMAGFALAILLPRMIWRNRRALRSID